MRKKRKALKKPNHGGVNSTQLQIIHYLYIHRWIKLRLLDFLSVIEQARDQNHYTWKNNRGGYDNMQERLDKFFAT